MLFAFAFIGVMVYLIAQTIYLVTIAVAVPMYSVHVVVDWLVVRPRHYERVQ